MKWISRRQVFIVKSVLLYGKTQVVLYLLEIRSKMAETFWIVEFTARDRDAVWNLSGDLAQRFDGKTCKTFTVLSV